MPVLKCTRKPLCSLEYHEVQALGYNILEESDYSVIDRETGEKPLMKRNHTHDENALITLVDRQEVASHIDIMCNSADITFDMHKETAVEVLFFSSFFADHLNYTVGEFAIFASNEPDGLYDDKNEVIHEKGSKDWFPGGRNNADWLYEVEGSCRYIGLRVYDANPTADIIRPKNFAVYSADYTARKQSAPSLNQSDITGAQPQEITKGKVFFDDELYNLKKGESLCFEATRAKSLDFATVITKGKADFTLCGKVADPSPLPFDRFVYRFSELGADGKITLYAKEDILLDYVGATSKQKEAEINFDDTIVDDFYSLGFNVLPMSFMPENINSGYNEVYWELERRRILLIKPNVVRMWYQPDWTVDTYEQYKNGDYDFDAPKMYSVYKYLDAFREAGTEVLFNFGWKVSSHVQEWFSFPRAAQLRNSAPRELDLFAKCCGATLNELINNRGYDNIKYLTFYNEPDVDGDPVNPPDGNAGDFIVDGPRLPYWEEMMRLSRREIDKYGLSHVEMWGAEESHRTSMQQKWIEYFEENCSDVLDMHTTHRYYIDVNDAEKYLDAIRSSAKTKPFFLTEIGQCQNYFEYTYNLNNIQLFSQLVNKGGSGMLLWTMNSVDLTDPLFFSLRDYIDLWDCMQYPNGIDNVREVYYELAQLCRYVPNHSKSVKSKVLYGDDMRVCAFKIGEDDYTVVVELDTAKHERDINLKFNKTIGKPMYRHIYKRPYSRNGNATLPPADARIFATDCMKDTIYLEDYQVIVYTTLPPIHQIEVSKTELILEPGESYLLSATNIDGSGGIKWEMGTAIGDSFELIQSDPSICAKKDAKSGDMCALRAVSETNPEAYAVTIVKIK